MTELIPLVQFQGIKACVFDAYGTLFDVHAAVSHHREKLGGKADTVSTLWRTKQLEYTWLRSLMGKYTSFWQVTQDALDYALKSSDIDNENLRADLLDAYWVLDAYPEVKSVLEKLVGANIKCAILSNGTQDMLHAAVKNAHIENLLTGIYSVEEAGVYKPDPRVYQLAVSHLEYRADEISFQSSNSWDAVGASAYGFQVAWINRFEQSRECLPDQPQAEIGTLEQLPAIVGI